MKQFEDKPFTEAAQAYAAARRAAECERARVNHLEHELHNLRIGLERAEKAAAEAGRILRLHMGEER